MRRLLPILTIPGARCVALLVCVCAPVGIMLSGCANSPYRKVLREMNLPTSERLDARVREVSRQHEAAMEHFNTTARLLAEISAQTSAPTEWDVYRCRDAVELCDWWVFNLDRSVRSIEDLVPQLAPEEPAHALAHDATADSSDGHVDGELANAAEYRALIAGLDHVREIMQEVSRAFAQVAESLAASSATDRVSVPDLTALREVVAGAVQQAEAVLEGSRRSGEPDVPG